MDDAGTAIMMTGEEWKKLIRRRAANHLTAGGWRRRE